MLAYQQADCGLTLEQGLAEYYGGHQGLAEGRGMSDDARAWFHCHDTVHVVFGCGITLDEEAMVKVWSVFGTTGGFGILSGYRHEESKEIYETIAWSTVPRVALRSAVLVPRVLGRCARMTRRWPWDDFEACLQTPLADIRREHGIQLVTAARQPS